MITSYRQIFDLEKRLKNVGGGKDKFADLTDVDLSVNRSGNLRWDNNSKEVYIDTEQPTEYTGLSTDANGEVLPVSTTGVPLMSEYYIGIVGRAFPNGVPNPDKFYPVTIGKTETYGNPPYIGRTVQYLKCLDENGQPLANQTNLTIKIKTFRAY